MIDGNRGCLVKDMPRVQPERQYMHRSCCARYWGIIVKMKIKKIKLKKKLEKKQNKVEWRMLVMESGSQCKDMRATKV